MPKRSHPPLATSAARIWGAPIALGALTLTGLVTALVSDTWGDAWSWFSLGVPVAVMLWFGLRRRPRKHSSTPARKLP